MFFEGDLRSGIALALKDSKYVACFIKGNNEQSALWEELYLKDDQIDLALSTKAVTLCIDADSQEAGYLSAYYPVPVVPALIVIQNGQLLLDLRSGESKDSFKAALLKSLIDTTSYTASTPSTSVAIADAESSTSQEMTHQHATQPSTSIDSSSNTSSMSNQPTMPLQTAMPMEPAPTITPNVHPNSPLPGDSFSTRSSQTIQNLLADPRRKLETDKKQKEATEKAERKAKTDARQAAMRSDQSSAKSKQATYAQEQWKRQQEAKLERERILRQIEHDKAERKEKEEQRKALAKAEAEVNDGAGGLVDAQLSKEISHGPRSAKAKECAIQVRMFDGTTIRSRFLADQTLRANVRPWVDKERLNGDLPYTFKQILAPLPNRTLSIPEEEESLQSLSLTPSATLVMVPVQGYTAAYGGNQSIVSKGAAAGYNVISAGAGLVSGALGKILGFGQATAPAEQSTTNEGSSQATSGSDTKGAASAINIRTLRDQKDDKGDHQFYNGNQLNFEPRKDNNDDKED